MSSEDNGGSWWGYLLALAAGIGAVVWLKKRKKEDAQDELEEGEAHEVVEKENFLICHLCRKRFAESELVECGVCEKLVHCNVNFCHPSIKTEIASPAKGGAGSLRQSPLTNYSV
jgi:hypothetical protein